jgi:hypothetical protein
MAKAPTDIRSLARSHTPMAVRTLAEICKSPKCNPGARVSAAVALLDRGWGKPDQTMGLTIVDKRDAADWTRDELVAFLNDSLSRSEGVAAAGSSDHKSDSFH